jgi:hypothetical protein
MRILIDMIPLQEAVCDECLMAWWRGLGPPEPPTQH